MRPDYRPAGSVGAVRVVPPSSNSLLGFYPNGRFNHDAILHLDLTEIHKTDISSDLDDFLALFLNFICLPN